LKSASAASGEEFVVWDELGAGVGSRVGVSEGREAAMPFHPERKPVDAYCACILDQIHLEQIQ
jgi:ethanolamine utilization protein EutN